MSHRSSRVLPSLAAFLAVGCSNAAAPGPHDEPALLRFSGQAAIVVAPDTVVRGASVPLTVTTFGGGCVRESARADVVPVPNTNGGSVVVRLYNRNSGGQVCASDLFSIEHRVTIVAPQANYLSIRIEGVNRGMETNWNTVPWVLTRDIIVR